MRRGDLWGNPTDEIRNMPGVGHKLAKRVIEDLGDGDPHAAIVTIERNPYSLQEVEGIAFRKADRIAKERFDVGPDDERRHEAGNRHILEQRGVLNEREFFAERVKLELRDANHMERGAEVEEGLYWLPEELEAERGLERWMRGLPRLFEDAPLAELTEAQQAVCARLKLDDQQIKAVRGILANPVMCLTGPAGSGKTHIIAAASQCLAVEDKSVRGMAFAGKAADRMREAFDKYGIMAEATTIHKALGFQKRAFTVEHLGEWLIIIDEASMLPNWLLWAVVRRLLPGVHLVLVGDPNQLPPIGYGTPFVDLLTHGVAHVHLEKNYRQADQQGILHMAEGILHRRRPSPAECVEMHLGVDSSNLDALFDGLIRTHGGSQFEDWQVITYQNENAERYNLRAQAVINPDGMPLFEYPLWKLGTGERNRPLYHAEIRTGDKVIVVKNSTLLGIFNGQTGRVIGLVTKPKLVQRRNSVTGQWEEQQGELMPHLRIEVTGRFVDIPEDEVEKHLQLGYVITVHKAQGSDWPRVIVMQPGKVRDDTARRFFYTAVSRAKDHLCVVSSLRVVAWWTNAASDAPDEPSTLLRRLARPAPEPVVLDIRPEFVPAAELLLGRPVLAQAAQDEPCAWCGGTGEPCACNGGQAAPEWLERERQLEEAAQHAAYQQLADGLAALAPESDPWDGDEAVYWPEQGVFPAYPTEIPKGLEALAEEIGVQEPLLVSEWDELSRAARIEEIRAQFRAMDLEVA